jgi:hypothetical protein
MSVADGLRNLYFRDPVKYIAGLEDVSQYKNIHGIFKYTNMIYSPTSTPSANERDSGPPQGRKVDLFPWILIAPYDDTWLVAIYQQKRFLCGTVSE